MPDRWPRVGVTIGTGCVVDETARLGLVREAAAGGLIGTARLGPVVVGAGTLISSFVTVHDSTVIGAGCFLDDRVRLGFGVRVGDGTRFDYAAFVCDRITIGTGCVIAGFVCDGVRIADRVVSMGNFVHKFSAPRIPWGVVEPAAVVGPGAVVGYGATIVGGVTIGAGSYVAAGAVVTRDVPPGHVVTGTNRMVPAAEWTGADLRLEPPPSTDE